jgi:tetratricopeptide (TPR) repeat protein
MAEKKLSRKELLKSPDEFLTATEKAVRFMQSHARPLIIGGVVLLVTVFVVVGLNWYTNYRADQAIVQYNLALEPIKGQADPTDDQLRKAIDELAEVADDFSGTSTGKTARLKLAELYERDGQYEKAAQTYQAYLAKIPKEEKSLAPFIQAAAAHAYESAEKWDQAIEQWEQVQKVGGDSLIQEAYLGQARGYLATGQKDAAKKAFNELQERFPGSRQTQIARAQMRQFE